ncbi:MAG TPA: MerR family transcriptional regulator [Acidimicrobiales bacterium]|nr:MerR family transcriptional regulator [Acidimicrobiales bacterium]
MTDNYPRRAVAQAHRDAIAQAIGPAPPPRAGLTSRQVCKQTGITYRKLDYWDRIGVLCPSIQGGDGIGSDRIYSQADCDVLVILEGCRRLGVPLTLLARIAQALRDGLTDFAVKPDGSIVLFPGRSPRPLPVALWVHLPCPLVGTAAP